MERRIYLNELYDYYGALLTEKQQKYFEDYYFDNYSLSEIALNNNVSRNAVHNQLKIVEEKLEFYEKKLALSDKKSQIISILENKVETSILEKVIDLL